MDRTAYRFELMNHVEIHYDEKFKQDDYVGLNSDPLHYHQCIIRRISQMTGQSRVLDIGCATGYLGEEIRKRKSDVVLCGIDLSRRALKRAELILDEVMWGNIEETELPWPESHFDAIICGDIIEHLFLPEAVLSKLKRHLKPNGLLFVSVPNVAYWRVRFNLMLGRWDYAQRDIMDSGHIRFYTMASAVRLIEGSGYVIHEVHAWAPFMSNVRQMTRGFLCWATTIQTRLCPRLFAHSFLYVATVR